MSVRTTVAETISLMPNLVTGSLHAMVCVIAYAALVVPGVGQKIHTKLMEFGHQYSEDSVIRAAENEIKIDRLSNLDNIEAQNAAQKRALRAAASVEAAAVIAPKIKEAAEKSNRKQIIEDQSKADLAVLRENKNTDIHVLRKKAQGSIAQTHAREQLEITRAEHDTKHGLREQDISHRTIMFSNLKTHLDTMTELTKTMAQSANTAKNSADSNTAQTVIGQQSVIKLTTAMDKAIEAYSNLQTALGDYDHQEAQGDAELVANQAIRIALLETMRAEKNMDSMIATSQIQDKLALKQAFKTDLAEKNKQLDAILGTYSLQTIAKLSELIQIELSAEQEKITTLTHPEDKDLCQAHLKKLSDMLDRVAVIQDEKAKLEPGATRNFRN